MDAQSFNNLIQGGSDENPGKIFPSRPTTDEFFLNYLNKGVMLIFNHHRYKNCTKSTRDGTHNDLTRLYETFTKIGYEVRRYTDETTSSIGEILVNVSNEDHSNNTSLIIVMLTHGDPDGVLHTHDSTMKVDDFWKPFTAEKCKSLAGKPKLFFIQACKGIMTDPGAFVEVESELDGQSTALCSKSIPQAKTTYVIPTLADILIFYCTAEGYSAFRSPNNGTCFIQSLCKIFSEFFEQGREMELMRVLTAVTRDVAYGYQSNFPQNAQLDACKQMPTIVSMLTKLFVMRR